MRRIATPIAAVSALAAVLLALAASPASACHRYGRHPCGYGYYGYGYNGFGYGPGPRPFEAWRAYYDEQAARSYARRTASANFYVATGRALPSRYFGPPTNYYAERYSQNSYLYFFCDLARRGEGTCDDPEFNGGK
jgi:hypothetical protein